jgi:hypothetical protein
VIPAFLALLFAPSPILDGVTTVAKPGIPGLVYALDSRATPFLVGETGAGLRPVGVAGQAGKGRVVAIAHDGYFGEGALDTGDTLQMVRNSIRWAAGKSDPTVGYSDVSAAAIRKIGFRTVELNGSGWDKVDVVVGLLKTDTQRVQKVLNRGGGAVSALTPWGWLMLNPGKVIWKDQSWSPILAQAGIAYADGMVDSVRPVKDQAEADSLRLSTNPSPLFLAEVVRSLSPDDPVRKNARKLTEKVRDVVPTEKTPLDAKHGLERLALVLRQLDEAEAKGRRADPAAADFPGAVSKTAPRVSRETSVRLDREHWQSTGLYAAPGEEITLTFPDDPPSGLRLQVGSHSDELWHLDTWKRHPSIVASVPVTGRTTKLRSPFGGLVYIAVDRPLKSEPVKARIENAVEAPRYVKGVTTPEEWKRQQTLQGPWAEFESESLIITVPSETARGVDDPKALMDLWDRTMALFAEFDGYHPGRPERIVADRQISAGYMHSGYPIMTWMDVTDMVTNVQRLTTEGSWGHWHELGHNRQKPAWTWDGTGEVTNNLFTLLAMERIAHRGIWDRLGKDKDAKLKKYRDAGAPYEMWKSDPFLALTMYAQLIEGFGWDPLSKVIKSYAPGEGEDWSDLKKRDEWMVRYSRQVGRNLGSFFESWGVPTSEGARDSLVDLPTWNPLG